MTDPMGQSNQPSLHVPSAGAGSVVYPPGGHYGPRIQRDLQLVLVHTGQATIHVDATIHHVPAGSVALLKPGHREEFFFSEHAQTWHRWVHMDPRSIPDATRNQLSELPVYIPISEPMNQLTDVMLSLSHSPISSNNSDLLCMLALSSLTLYATESQREGLEAAVHPAVLLTKTHIHAHYGSFCTLKSFASAANVSAEYLVRLFQKSEGITPMRYLWRIRTARAIELLRSTGLSLEEIADQTGFQSLYHLSRTIKSATGSTPTQIRRSSRQNDVCLGVHDI